MKSVRLDPELSARLRQAALVTGVSESKFMRDAIAERTEKTLGNLADGPLAGIVGAVHSTGGRARDAHHEYLRLLKRRQAKIK